MSQSAQPAESGEAPLVTTEASEEKNKKRQRLLWLLLLVLLLLFCCVSVLFFQYLRKPAPLPDMLPVPVNLNYPPHYLFSIYGVDQPIGVTLSPSADRLYVTETGGARLIKMFDREGHPLGDFAPPGTSAAERAPVYAATDSAGRVFVTDRLQHAVFVYDARGQYLDTFLSPYLTLSEYIAKHAGGLTAGTVFTYSIFANEVRYSPPLTVEQTLPPPSTETWAPLGIMFDKQGNFYLTDVGEEADTIRSTTANQIQANTWLDFNPIWSNFGQPGQDNGQFLYPNDIVLDSLGRAYVVDGNNGRISMWSRARGFLQNFGKGSGAGALNLPRGADIDSRDRLYVVDAVGQGIKVYDVSKDAPTFLFAFGDLGLGNGQFNYPNDIVLDNTGRLYITDRENNRVQVWSY